MHKRNLSLTLTSSVPNLSKLFAERLGRLAVLDEQSRSLHLRRLSRIRTVHGSLAIEGNTLNEQQITAILDGNRVLAPPVREVSSLMNDPTPHDTPHVTLQVAALLKSLEKDAIEMTLPDKPRSRLQRYRLTTAGQIHGH